MRTGPGRLRRLSTALGATLFPDAPDDRRTLRGAELAVVLVSVLAIGVFLHLLRLGLSTSLNSFWAEDGTIFFDGGRVGESIFAPYTNYLVLVPRLIGAAAAAVPLRDAPAATSILAALAAAVSGLAVWVASSGHIRSPYLRAALAAATVLAPVSGLESTDSGSYASWYMLFATFWLLLWRPKTDWGALLGSLFILLTTLSNASVWFLIPIAALRLIAIRDRRDAMIVASFALGSVIQVPVALTHGQMAEPTWSADIWSAYAQRVINGAALGLRLGGIAWRELGWAFLAPLLGLVVIGLGWGIRRAGPAARALAIAAIATSVVMFFAVCYQRDVGSTIVWQSGAYSGAVSRYVIVPALLLLSAALALLDSSLRDRAVPGRLPSWPIAATAVLVVAVIGISFYQGEPEVRGTPGWDVALEAAAAECHPGGPTEVPVETSPPGFGVIVPCDKIPESLGGPPSN
jgi:hypothetical protein